MSDLADFLVHTVQVETYLGQGDDGADLYADPVTVPGFLDGKRTLVRAATGEEVISSSTFYTERDREDLFPDLSRVSIRAGVTSTVVAVSAQDSGSLGLPDHLVVSLT